MTLVLDTHVLVWWVSGAAKLSSRAERLVRTALKTGPVIASAISVFEITTAVRRGRLVLGCSLDQWLSDVQRLPDLRFEPVSVEVARLAGAFEEGMPGDPADRLIVATAAVLGARLVTADRALRRSPAVSVVW
jgi:PIN domain nuclease of toxin-antitoxin system